MAPFSQTASANAVAFLCIAITNLAQTATPSALPLWMRFRQRTNGFAVTVPDSVGISIHAFDNGGVNSSSLHHRPPVSQIRISPT